jgi:hypothetical protein
MSRWKPISRRTVLKSLLGGAVATVPLPWLEAMREAKAGPKASPDRFGLWFWGNGVRPEHWTPGSEGEGWAPSEELAPLSALTDQVSVLSGFEIKTATHPHHSGMAGVLTGQHYHQLGTVRDTIVSTFAGQSVDQIAADHFAGQTPFRSLELGVTWFRGTDEGSTFQHLSHNGPNNVNPSEYDAVRAYERLFALPTDAQRDLARASVLDTLQWKGSRLQTRLGHTDSIRMEQYLDSVRALEKRIGSDVSACTATVPDSSYPDVAGQEQIEEKNLAMSQLLAMSLSCDLTRSFSIQFSTCGSGAVFWQVGATNSLHSTCHEEPLPQPTVHAATTFTMERLADFLGVLRDTPDGEGSLLDSCSILCTSELSDGWTHANTEFPLLIAGGGNGRLRPGTHYRSVGRNTSDAGLTALRGAGVDLASFGTEAGYSDSPVTEILG